MVNNDVLETVEDVKDAEKNISKPLTVARQEFIESQINLINEAGLPAFIIMDVLKDVQLELQKQSTEQYESDKKTYEDALKDSN